MGFSLENSGSTGIDLLSKSKTEKKSSEKKANSNQIFTLILKKCFYNWETFTCYDINITKNVFYTYNKLLTWHIKTRLVLSKHFFSIRPKFLIFDLDIGEHMQDLKKKEMADCSQLIRFLSISQDWVQFKRFGTRNVTSCSYNVAPIEPDLQITLLQHAGRGGRGRGGGDPRVWPRGRRDQLDCRPGCGRSV